MCVYPPRRSHNTQQRVDDILEINCLRTGEQHYYTVDDTARREIIETRFLSQM